MIQKIEQKSNWVLEEVVRSTIHPKKPSLADKNVVLTFNSPFSTVVMDKGFEFTTKLVEEIKTFLVTQGITDTLTNISVVTCFSTDLGSKVVEGNSFTKLVAYYNKDKKLEVMLYFGDHIQDTSPLVEVENDRTA